MRRKRFGSIFGDVGSLDESESQSLDFSSNKIDRPLNPHLSKSAPCKCCGGCGQICVTVSGCHTPTVQGVVVTILDVTATIVIGSATTNSSGVACISIPSADYYKIKLDPTGAMVPVGYAISTEAVAGAYTCSTNNVSRALAIASGYVCVACCSFPIATTLYVDGTVAMSYLGLVAGKNTWRSSNQTVTGTGVSSCNTPFSCVQSASWIYSYQLACDPATGLWTPQSGPSIFWCPPNCTTSDFLPGSPTGASGCTNVTGTHLTGSPISCTGPPFSLSFTQPSSFTITSPCGGTATVNVPAPVAGSHTITF